MAPGRTAIVEGTVVGPSGSLPGDVLVSDGVIADVGWVDRTGAAVVEADGCLVLPGGVDVHTHVFGLNRKQDAAGLKQIAAWMDECNLQTLVNLR